MSDVEVLDKAVRKAIDGGWEYGGYDWRIQKDFRGKLYMQTYTNDGSEVYELEQLSINDVIFNHGFAEALWKNATSNSYYHLQYMVIADDPIKYLGDNI